MENMYELQDITELFRTETALKKYLNVSAPMVRYSKLQFRRLLRQNNVRLCYTPMIVAHSFNRSEEARRNEFSTDKDDHPLIAQFAAEDAIEMLEAAKYIIPYANGVDLNCGCPQSWAICKGYGCALLRSPELMEDIVKTLRRNTPAKFSVSIKLRLLQEDIKSTVDLCQKLEKCGVTYLVIHGRTQWQKNSHPLDVSAMADIKKSIQIPLVVNGNVRTKLDADQLYEQTKADGVMVARGILANPSLFTGTEQTTTDCLQQWLDIAQAAGDDLSFQCFHHHLTFMWGKHMQRRRRVHFNNFSKKEQVFDFFHEIYGIRPLPIENYPANTICKFYHHSNYKSFELKENGVPYLNGNWDSNQSGKFYTTFKDKVLEAPYDEDDLYFQNGSIFDL